MRFGFFVSVFTVSALALASGMPSISYEERTSDRVRKCTLHVTGDKQGTLVCATTSYQSKSVDLSMSVSEINAAAADAKKARLDSSTASMADVDAKATVSFEEQGRESKATLYENNARAHTLNPSVGASKLQSEVVEAIEQLKK